MPERRNYILSDKDTYGNLRSTFKVQGQRSLDTRIYKIDIQIRAVLGSLGCRENNIQTAIRMLLLRSVFFYVFMVIKKFVAS